MRVHAQALDVTRGGARVVRALSLAAEPGTLLGLIGANGAGKTSLLRVLAALDAPSAGRVTYDGRTAQEIGRRAMGRAVAYLPQNGRIHWPLPVADIVALGRLPHGAARHDAAVERAMAAADITRLAHRAAGTLSGGERARVLLARALAVEAPVLLADEPVAALDPYHQIEVMELLRATARGGATVIAVLHDLTLAARFCDRIALMREGALLAEGPPAAVLTAELLAEAYAVTVVTGSHEGAPFVLPWARLPGAGHHPATRPPHGTSTP